MRATTELWGSTSHVWDLVDRLRRRPGRQHHPWDTGYYGEGVVTQDHEDHETAYRAFQRRRNATRRRSGKVAEVDVRLAHERGLVAYSGASGGVCFRSCCCIDCAERV